MCLAKLQLLFCTCVASVTSQLHLCGCALPCAPAAFCLDPFLVHAAPDSYLVCICVCKRQRHEEYREKERVRQVQSEGKRGRGERDIVHLLVHFSRGCNGWGWLRLKLGIYNCSGSATWVAGAHACVPSSAGSSGALAASWIGSGVVGIQTVAIMGHQCHRQQVNPTVLQLRLLISFL